MSALCQSRPTDLDVVGLKLGMKIDEAKAQLLKYKPEIWVVTSYLTEDSKWWPAGVFPQTDAGMSLHPYHDAKLKVPVQIGAGYFDKTYVQYPKLRSIDKLDTPIEQYSGEFFRLSFAPSDKGGRLYSIVRQRTYFSDASKARDVYAAAQIPLPKVADLESAIIEKYGNPVKTDKTATYVSLGWIYDQGGAKLSNTSGEFERCESRFDGEDGAMSNPGAARFAGRQGQTSPLWAIRKTGGNGYLTQQEFAAAFTDREFYKLGYHDSKTFLDDPPKKLLNELVPHMVTDAGLRPQDTQGTAQLRECGIQLHIVIGLIADPERAYASSLTVSLSNQNAEFFDNGILEYMKARLAGLNRTPPPSAKEKF